MSCHAGPGIEPGPSALKASALPIELTWQINLLLPWVRQSNPSQALVGHNSVVSLLSFASRTLFSSSGCCCSP